MPGSQQRDEHLIDRLALADDGLADFVAQHAQHFLGTRHFRGVERHGVSFLMN